MDVALVSYKDGKPHKILFLESKFTEYLTHCKTVELADRYKDFYKKYNPTIAQDDFQATVIKGKYCLNSGNRTSNYLGGIKQAFSHIIGLATEPKADQSSHEYKEIFERAEVLEFATIVFDCDEKNLTSYRRIYEKTFSESQKSRIEKALEAILPDEKYKRNIARIVIHPKIMTY